MQLVWCSVFVWIVCHIGKSTGQVERDDFSEEEDDDDFSPMLGSRNNRFDWTLVSALQDFESNNLLWSPFSIKFLMVLLYEASIKETSQELKKVLQLENNRMLVRARYGSLVKIIQAENPDYELVMKSRLFVDRQYGPQQWYQNLLARDYDSYVQRVNFNNVESAAGDINKWIRDATHNHIDNIVTGDSVKGSEVILMNALYFRGLWQRPFLPEDSFVGRFVGKTSHVPTRFMTQTDLFYLSESDELDAQLLRMPYKGKKIAMYIVLPKKEDGLEPMIRKMRPFLLNRLIWQLEQNMVSVTLPTFKFESTISLKEVLTKMGVTALFSKYDNLIGIKSRVNRRQSYVRVSSIIHKTTIEVTESGTVATAITDTRFVNKFDFPPVIFNASHPFMFFIKNEETGTIIFQGNFVDPDEKIVTLSTEKSQIPQDREEETNEHSSPQQRNLVRNSIDHHRRRSHTT